MAAATVRGSSPIQRMYPGNYPLGVYGALIGFPNRGPLHTLGNWQTDNAVDIAVATGTDVVAVTTGTVRARGSWATPYNPSSPSSGWEVLLFGDDGGNYFYSRLSQRFVVDGQRVLKGQVIGKSGGSSSVPHLHIAIQPPLNNLVFDPSFETDAVGAHPAAWTNSFNSIWTVSNAWSSHGAQSLYVETGAVVAGFANAWLNPAGLHPAPWGQFAVTAGQQLFVRYDINIVAVSGTLTPVVMLNYYDNSGTPVGGGSPVALTGPQATLGIVTFAVIFTAPLGATATSVAIGMRSGASAGGQASYYMDAVLVVAAPPGPALNPVLNPSFEYDTIGVAPAAWSTTAGGVFLTAGSTLSVQSGGIQGGKCMRVAATANLQGAGAVVAGPFTAGQPSTFSIWLQSTGAPTTVDIEFGNNSDFHGTLLTIASTWQRYSVTWTPTTTVATATIATRSDGAPQTWNADGAQVSVGATAPQAYFDGDTPGYAWSALAGASPTCAAGSMPDYNDGTLPSDPQAAWG